MKWAKKCISDGANVNYQDEVSYHIEGSVVNAILFTCTKLIVALDLEVLDLYLDQSSFVTIYCDKLVMYKIKCLSGPDVAIPCTARYALKQSV